MLINVEVKEFKKMSDPFEKGTNVTKYRFYINVKNVPSEIQDWMETNPREQKMTTDVTKAIEKSLKEDNKSFHLWNRGLLLSANKVSFNNKTNIATIEFTDKKRHGNIDGGHTYKKILQIKDSIIHDQYVEVEVLTGLDTPEQLAEARNTSTAVDTKSIEELRNSFGIFKNILKDEVINDENYFKRIAFKQNEHYGDDAVENIIDVREIIAIINMFSPVIYKDKNIHPIQSYTGKETSLRKFLKLGKKDREIEIDKMSNIIPEIFKLWDHIEYTFVDVTKSINKRYGRKSYSNYKVDENDNPIYVDETLFSRRKTYYSIPRGLMYPLVGAFRALVVYDENKQKYIWSVDPFSVWDEVGANLVNIILQSSEDQRDNPNAVGKSANTWDLLYKEIYIVSLESKK